MTDIVERLRSPEVFIVTSAMVSPVAYEAADEIERLRAALKPFSDIAKYIDEHCPDAPDNDETCASIGDFRNARKALEGK